MHEYHSDFFDKEGIFQSFSAFSTHSKVKYLFILVLQKMPAPLISTYKQERIIPIHAGTKEFKKGKKGVDHMGEMGYVNCQEGPVAQWIRRLTTDQEILGSSPGRVAWSNHFSSLFLFWRFGRANVSLTFELRNEVCYRVYTYVVY